MKTIPPVTDIAAAAKATAIRSNTMRSFSMEIPTPIATGSLSPNIFKRLDLYNAIGIRIISQGRIAQTKGQSAPQILPAIHFAIKSTLLDVKHADKYRDKTLHYSVKSLRHFKNKTVLISGGGNAAIDWALELEPIAKKVYVSYRKDTFKGHEAQVTELLNSSITCCFHTSITRLNGNITDGVIKSVELTDLSTNTVTELTVDDVIINHGYEREAKLLKNSDLDIRLKEDFFIDGNALSESNIAGLYAAGDILKYDGKVHLIVGAFQDAVNAVNRAKQFIEKEAEEFPMVSSHNELLKERSMELMKQINE